MSSFKKLIKYSSQILLLYHILPNYYLNVYIHPPNHKLISLCFVVLTSMQELTSLISGFGLTLCFLINRTMPHLPSVASAKISKSLSVIGFVFLSALALGSNFERQIVLMFFSCKIFSCLGFSVFISFNIAGPCNLCCFFDGACHFCGFDVQV